MLTVLSSLLQHLPACMHQAGALCAARDARFGLWWAICSDNCCAGQFWSGRAMARCRWFSAGVPQSRQWLRPSGMHPAAAPVESHERCTTVCRFEAPDGAPKQAGLAASAIAMPRGRFREPRYKSYGAEALWPPPLLALHPPRALYT